MEKRYYTSTNWGPWLGFGFLLSSLCFSLVSHNWLLVLLILLCFLPAIVVAFTLNSYFLIENNQLKYCYDRKAGRETERTVSLTDVVSIKRVGKSVSIAFDNEEGIIKRVHEADVFVQDMSQRNQRIEING